MNTRFTAITIIAGLAVGAAILPIAGPAVAAPDTDEPTLEPGEPGDDVVVPTSGPPPTFDVDEDTAAAGPVFFEDLAPERTPVTTLAARSGRTDPDTTKETNERVGEPIDPSLRVDPIDEATWTGELTIDPEFLPTPKYLAPCGLVPHNLDPQGPILLADMTGDGTPDDRLSIRQVGSGAGVEYRLHLELDDGTRSESHIAAFDGYLPTISDTIKLWQESTTDHPAPAADEVLVTFGEVGTTRYWRLFGTDERGCIDGYTNEIGSPVTVMFRHDSTYRAGWHCNSLGHIKVEDATHNGDGTWALREWALRRTGPTTVESMSLGSAAAVPESAVPTYGAGC